MVSADAMRTVVGIIGNVISFILFLSPVQTFVRIWKKGSVEQYSPVPYLATLFNCMAWALYGLPVVHPNSLLVVTINGSAIFIELSYVILFLIFSSDKKQRLKVLLVLLLELGFMALLAFLVIKLAHTHNKRSLIVGLVCILGNIMMYASPLSVMKLVITTKSVEYMPFFLSLFSFFNSVAWFTYALIRFDIFLTIPNGLGLLFGSAQLLLYATYYKNTKRLMAEKKARQLSLTEVVSGRDEPKKIGRIHHSGRAPSQNNGA
ncbi:bidirectional sugar transporter SWEET4-like [Pyrus ussuriensis x Pyrus communis]|uniref:Bidirectional sugar transporter SWEET n=1 Tax=Pyrus ussuriensis x Pyrus communis TaxID=2448454 RepID=A0A5N5HZH2_9ROSA|nr:bidirectional sugar transporter SWEET4 [Pyrus x bretschneideri]KAB2632948.1 bidirectional sugar transporter SWEET4-like [Pyrus ussuriensis x Pyrus communis]